MKIKKKCGNVPKLRFPEFRDKSEWQKSELGELSQVLRGGSPRPIDSYLTNEPNGLNWLKIGDVNKDSKYVIQTKEKVNHNALSKTRIVYPGDLILSNSMSFGRPYILKIKSCIHDGWIAITQISKEIERNYLYYLISAPESQRFFKNNAAGSGVQNLNADIIKSLPVPFPSDDIEQQKIADCLSSLDNVISLQTQKIDTLQQYKKGLMQKLFPAEGETVPELRFEGFEDEEEWHSLNLGSCLLKRPEYGVNAPAVPFSKELPTYLRITDIAENGSFIHEQKTSVAKSVTDSNYLKKGDIVLARTGASVGKSYLYNEKDGALVFAGFLIRVRPDQKKLDSEFLFQYFKTEQYWKWVSLNSARSGQPGINGSEYSAFPIVLPSIQEQQKIADCLSSLDELIATETKKLAALKTHKTGLMQQLFPAMDEVNA